MTTKKLNTKTMVVSDPKQDVSDATEAFIAVRRAAYCRMFDPKSADARIVLQDIIKFCRVAEPEYHVDPREHARYAGRRKVGLRVVNHLYADIETLFRLFNPRV